MARLARAAQQDQYAQKSAYKERRDNLTTKITAIDLYTLCIWSEANASDLICRCDSYKMLKLSPKLFQNPPRGSFLESPGNLSGLQSQF